VNVQVYALRQVEGCVVKRARLKIERYFIGRAGQNLLNVAVNPIESYNAIVHHPLITPPHFTHYTRPWTLYDSHYTNLQPKTSGSYIYILFNKKSLSPGNVVYGRKRFYIGQTGNAWFFKRMKGHRYYMAMRAIFKMQEEKYLHPFCIRRNG